MQPADRAPVVLTIDLAFAVVIQASGVKGTPVTVLAAAVLVASVAYLALRPGTQPLSNELRRLVQERSVSAPRGRLRSAARNHAHDSIDCFRTLHAAAVRETLLRHLDAGLIGAREARRLNEPHTLADLDALADRLDELEALAARRGAARGWRRRR